jgi:hypothetical protein
MIKITELRFGNLLKIFGITTRVEGITPDELIHSSNYSERPLSDFEPIDLSIELIKENHFVEHSDTKTSRMPEYTDGRIILRFHEKGVSVFTPIDMPWATPDFPLHMYYINSINYVHELQNTYFMLFKEEIDLNL